MSSTRPRVRRTSSAGARATMCRSEPAPAQTVGMAKQRSLDQARPARARAGTGPRHRAGSRSRRRPPGASRRSTRFASTSRAHLPRVGSTVARHERDEWRPVGEEDERLDDLAERAADRVGRRFGGRRLVRILLQPRLGPGVTEEPRDPLDRLRPLHVRELRETAASARAQRSPRIRGTPRGDGVPRPRSCRPRARPARR